MSVVCGVLRYAIVGNLGGQSYMKSNSHKQDGLFLAENWVNYQISFRITRAGSAAFCVQ